MTSHKHKNATRIIVVDDSQFIRQLFASRLNEDPMIDVVATAEDAFKARELIKQHNPDMITLDIEMPGMDGISFLEKIMKLRPMPVIMASTLTEKGADITIQALEMGALDYVTKPTQAGEDGWDQAIKMLISKIKMAASATVTLAKAEQRLQTNDTSSAPPAKSVTANATAGANIATTEAPKTKAAAKVADVTDDHWKGAKQCIIPIGASTGGVEALNTVLSQLPGEMPPIVITQHMPPVFTASFAKRLDKQCALKVVEAQHQQKILRNHVYIAPGSHHLRIHHQPNSDQLWCRLDDGDEVSGHRPSVDYMFSTVLNQSIAKPITVMLTGMGQDGAKEMLNLRKAGAITLGQNEASCIVYGMPRAAMELGAVMQEHNVKHMAQAILTACKENGYE